jgi:hypothetical protein
VPRTASRATKERFDAIRRAPVASRSGLLAELIVEARGRCEAVQALFKRVADASPAQKNGVLLEGLVAAIRACGCDAVDVDALEAAVVAALVNREPSLRARPASDRLECQSE